VNLSNYTCVDETQDKSGARESLGEEFTVKVSKTIGLAVLAAGLLIAFVGTSQALASETVLCKSGSSSCTGANRYASGTLLTGTSSNFAIKTNLGSIACESSFEGKTGGEVSKFELQGCHIGGATCTESKAEHLPYSTSIANAGGGNGKLTMTGSGGEASLHFRCGALVVCTFSATPSFALEGGNPAHLSVAQSMKRSGGICPSTAEMTGSFTVTSPQPLYVGQANAVLFCNVGEAPCPPSHEYASGTKFEAWLAKGTEATIASNLGNWKCPESTFGGETTAESGEKSLPATIGSFSWKGCTNPFTEACTVTSEGMPYATSFFLENEEVAQMKLEGFDFHWRCGSHIACTFSAKEAFFSFTGGSPAYVEIHQGLSRAGTLCPSESFFEAKYEFISPKPLYLAYNP
jgi:hypothetical protein